MKNCGPIVLSLNHMVAYGSVFDNNSFSSKRETEDLARTFVNDKRPSQNLNKTTTLKTILPDCCYHWYTFLSTLKWFSTHSVFESSTNLTTSLFFLMTCWISHTVITKTCPVWAILKWQSSHTLHHPLYHQGHHQHQILRMTIGCIWKERRHWDGYKVL